MDDDLKALFRAKVQRLLDRGHLERAVDLAEMVSAADRRLQDARSAAWVRDHDARQGEPVALPKPVASLMVPEPTLRPKAGARGGSDG